MRDEATGQSRLLVETAFDLKDRLTDLRFNGQLHQFSYENGRNGQLSAWQHPDGCVDSFRYGEAGQLACIEEKKVTSGEVKLSSYRTEYVRPKQKQGAEKDNPANYRLVSDGTWTYQYTNGELRDKGTRFSPHMGDSVSVVATAGNLPKWQACPGVHPK